MQRSHQHCPGTEGHNILGFLSAASPTLGPERCLGFLEQIQLPWGALCMTLELLEILSFYRNRCWNFFLSFDVCSAIGFCFLNPGLVQSPNHPCPFKFSAALLVQVLTVCLISKTFRMTSCLKSAPSILSPHCCLSDISKNKLGVALSQNITTASTEVPN